MADPISIAGLALAAFTTLKEVYLLSRFVYRVCRSAAHHIGERTELSHELMHELLFAISFRFVFLEDDGISMRSDLDKLWIEDIQYRLDKIRKLYADYAKLASLQDEEYKTWSPFMETRLALDPAEDVFLLENTPDSQGNSNLPRTQSWLHGKFRDIDWDWKWPLFEKRGLEKLIKGLHKNNKAIKDIIVALNRRPSSSRHVSPVSAKATGTDIDRLGLQDHLRIREIHEHAIEDTSDTSLRVIEPSPDMSQTPLLSLQLVSGLRTRSKALVEYKVYQSHGGEVHQLASLLRSAGEASEGSNLLSLPFRGYVDHPNDNLFAFYYEFPTKTKQVMPVSLHDCITGQGTPPIHENAFSLPRRFAVAQAYAKALWTFHQSDWVHKSIWSRSLVFFEAMDGSYDFSKPHLIGFEYSRPVTTDTLKSYDDDPERNLYRHPDRQGMPDAGRGTIFQKHHDLYSLGVVLLEIGLWQTAETLRDAVALSRHEKPERIYRQKLQALYIEAARTRLAHSMGPAYVKAVVACLEGSWEHLTDTTGCGIAVWKGVIENLDSSMLA
jgi:hypothetical protein